jgi:hypothetical protein
MRSFPLDLIGVTFERNNGHVIIAEFEKILLLKSKRIALRSKIA